MIYWNADLAPAALCITIVCHEQDFLCIYSKSEQLRQLHIKKQQVCKSGYGQTRALYYGQSGSTTVTPDPHHCRYKLTYSMYKV